MSISSDIIRGHTETIIMSQLLHGDSYGYQINKAILDKTEGEFEIREATLYTTFRRLEESGCICSYWGDEATGARRKYYTLTDTGKQTLLDNKGEWQQAKTIIDRLLAD